jgi:hypothetical protein
MRVPGDTHDGMLRQGNKGEDLMDSVGSEELNLIKAFLRSLTILPFLEPKPHRRQAWEVFGAEILGLLFMGLVGLANASLLFRERPLSQVAWQSFAIILSFSFLGTFLAFLAMNIAFDMFGRMLDNVRMDRSRLPDVNMIAASALLLLTMAFVAHDSARDRLPFSDFVAGSSLQESAAFWWIAAGIFGVKVLPYLVNLTRYHGVRPVVRQTIGKEQAVPGHRKPVEEEGGRRLFTTEQVCLVLDIDPRTLRRWMEEQDLSWQSDPVDREARRIDEQQLALLARCYGRPLWAPVGVQELSAKLREQKAEIELLRERLKAFEPAPSPVQTQPGTSIDGNMSKRACIRLAVRHGVKEGTCRRWEWPHESREDDRSALLYARQRMSESTRKYWHECEEDPQCPCHSDDALYGV